MTGPVSFIQQARAARKSGLVAITTRSFDRDGAATVLTVRDSAGDTRHETQLGDVHLAAAEWNPAGDTLAYVAQATDGPPQVHLLQFGGAPASDTRLAQLTHLPYGVNAGHLDWSPAGDGLLVTAPTVDRRDPAAPYRVTRRTWRHDGLGLVQDQVNDICLIDLDGGVTWLAVTGSGIAGQPRWSPDGRRMSCLVTFEDVADATPSPSLRVWSADDRTALEVLPATWGWIESTRWAPDGRRLLVLGAPHSATRSLFATRLDVWLVDLDGTVRNLTESLPGGAGSRIQADMGTSWPAAAANLTFLDDRRTLLFTAEAAGRTYVGQVDIESGRPCERVAGSDLASYALLDVQTDDAGAELLLLESALDLAPRLVKIPAVGGVAGGGRVAGGGGVAGVEPRRDRMRPRVHHYAVPSADGPPIDTWVVLPDEGEPPYPAVLKIHGGPYGSVGDVYSEDVALLARRGYAVMLHNFRGSYGYGTESAARISADWGVLGERDHHGVVAHIVSLGIIDPARVGVLGLSHGGFAVCWLVGRSDVFAAAVAENPMTNFHSVYRSSDIGPWYLGAEFGADIAENPEGLLTRSPISHAHRCTTPTLLIQGEQDLRCPAEQTDQMYAALWAAGCEVEMLRFPRGGHTDSIYGSHGYRQSRLDAVTDWFEQHLGAAQQPNRMT